MARDLELFEKTFDQQVDTIGDKVATMDIAPNVRIATEMVLEPLANGVRVTARDANHSPLWGFIGSQGMLSQTHCPVAVYDTLEQSVTDALKRMGAATTDPGEPMENARGMIAELERTLATLKKSIDVKKVSEATIARARKIAAALKDANKQILLETNIGVGA